MKIFSPAFQNGGHIPDRFSQYDQDISPPLKFEDVPTTARSIAFIMEDPDTSHGTVTHWVGFNIGPNHSGIPENKFPEEGCQGANTKGESSYMGPKPPDGEHRYFFRLYALDCELDLRNGATRDELERAMKGHVIAEAEWMGRYATPAHASR